MALKRSGIGSSNVLALALLILAPLVHAQSVDAPPQYMYDPSNADEQRGIKYFGAAKDANGVLLKDVTFQLVTAAASYVYVTNDQGRFRANLPEGLSPEKVKATCFKPGFEMVRVEVRAGPKAPRPTVEVNCFLRAASGT